MSVQELEGSDTLLASKWEIADDQMHKAEQLFIRTAERGHSFNLADGGLIDLLIRDRPEGRVVAVNYEFLKLALGEKDDLVEHRAARKLTVSPGAGRLVLAGKDYDLRAEAAMRAQLEASRLTPDESETSRLGSLLASMHNARHLDLPQPPPEVDPIAQAALAAEFQQILYRTLSGEAA